MRTVIPLLQLLALGHQAAAAVCRPSPSSVSVESVTSASTVASSTASSSESVSLSATETVSLSTTASSTETLSTETATLSTDSSTVVSTTSSASESISTESSTITSSADFTSSTSTAEASTSTTTSVSGPPELLINRGFENKDSLDPWQRYQTSATVTVSTDVSHSDDQSAHVTWTSPMTPMGQYNYQTGIFQNFAPGQVVANTAYEFSVWVKLEPGLVCDDFYISCTINTSSYIPSSSKNAIRVGNGVWQQVVTTCQWTQNWLNQGPAGVRVSGLCKNADYYVDDASFKLKV